MLYVIFPISEEPSDQPRVRQTEEGSEEGPQERGEEEEAKEEVDWFPPQTLTLYSNKEKNSKKSVFLYFYHCDPYLSHAMMPVGKRSSGFLSMALYDVLSACLHE